LLQVIAIFELVSGAAIFDQAKGSGRASGKIYFYLRNIS
jgi:hypothetical protein